MRLVWSPRARSDREDAIDYIAADNPAAALQQFDEIEGATDRLVEHPQLGRADRVKGTRELVIPRTQFIAIYRVAGDAVQILRILHGAQQWP